MSEFKFEAHLTKGGLGSRILLNGVEVPEVTRFSVGAAVDQVTTLKIESLAIERVEGFVGAVHYVGHCWVACNGARPIGVFMTDTAADEFLNTQQVPYEVRGIYRLPLEVTTPPAIASEADIHG
jgi:hypothetical protein